MLRNDLMACLADCYQLKQVGTLRFHPLANVSFTSLKWSFTPTVLVRLIKQTRISVTTPVFLFVTNMFCFWMHHRVNLNIWKRSRRCWQEGRAHRSGNAKQDKQADDGLIGVGGDNGGWMPHLSALRHTLNMAVMCDVRDEHPGAILTEEVVEGWRQDQRDR